MISMDSYPKFDLTIPFRVRDEARCRLRILDPFLRGSGHHFVRFDLYPLVTPTFGRRHYGWWDIPLKHLRDVDTELIFAPLRGKLAVKAGLWGRRMRTGYRTSLKELGYCKLHVSLWERDGDKCTLVSLRSYPLLIFSGNDLPPLKGFNIPVTDRCNLKCTMCPRQGTESLVEADIQDEVLDALVRDSGQVKSILLQGLGEPLIYRNLPRVISRLKREMAADGDVGLTTNGTLLDLETARSLMDAGLDFLYFSVDAASKTTYQPIRVGADFDSVIRNVRDFAALRAVSGTGKPKCMMNFVVMGRNFREVPEFVEVAAQLGIESVCFSHCLDTASGGHLALDSAALTRLFETATQIGERRGISVFVPSVQRESEEKCLFMERVVVLGSGDVLPCHAMAPGYNTNRKVKVFGNVNHESLAAIWNKPEVRDFRRRVLEGDFPEECDGCDCKAFLVP